MKPGRGLDKLVDRAMGYNNNYPPRYSTSWQFGGKAWEWLTSQHESVMIGLESDGTPAVFEMDAYTTIHKVLARGETFQHAISLAVLEIVLANNEPT